MIATRKFIVISSIIVGVIMLLLGLASNIFYIYSVIHVLDTPDQSIIFWYLVFVFIGIALITVGIYFIWIGYKSNKEEIYIGLAKYIFGGFGAIIVILILLISFREWTSRKTSTQKINQEYVKKSLAAKMYIIERIEIDEFDQTGFSFSVHIAEGEEGSYWLRTSIDDGQAVFLEKVEEVELNNSESVISRSVSFEQLFQKCFNEFRESNIYVCIENTGATSFFTLESQLILIRDKQQKITNTKNKEGLISVGKTKFTMDTFTENMEVKVTRFQPADR